MARRETYTHTVMTRTMANGSQQEHAVHVTAETKSCYYSQVLATLAVSLGPFSAGLAKGYSSPAIASLQQRDAATFSVTTQQVSWVASLSLLGALFGGIVGGVTMRYGRRRLLIAVSIPLTACWLLTVFAINVEIICLTAFVGGFCVCIIQMVTQVYVSEISVPVIRGALSALLKISGHIGVLVSFVAGAWLNWRQLAAMIAVAPMGLLLAAVCIPETPSYLALRGRHLEAERSLMWLRGRHVDVRPELDTIRINLLTNRNNPVDLIYLVQNLRYPVLVTCGLMFFQRFSGTNSFYFYTVSVLQQTFEGMDPHGAAIAVSIVQLLATLLSGLLVDTAGRLPLLVAGNVLMSLSLAAFGSFAYYKDVHKHVIIQLDWIPLLCVLVFTVAFSLGISPISWLLVGELFPLEHRAVGTALATSFSYFCAFVGVKTFVDFQEWIGLHGAFWVYAALSVCGLCFVVCCVPETKGSNLNEMQAPVR